jgi:PhzF family phenazine biosynthesis protein
MAKLPMVQIDAFTDHIFGGNPAAVIPLDKWIADELMQQIAEENNLSATVFIVPEQDQYAIRWFTPNSEVDLCGHATLAAAHYLFTHHKLKKDQITFSSKSGKLKVDKLDDGYLMDFPTDVIVPIDTPNQFESIIGKPVHEAWQGKDDILVGLSSFEEVVGLKPDFEKIKKLGGRGIIVTAPGKTTDIVSRCFYPAFGIDEDPVTGSAHTTLAPYWSESLKKQKITAFQASARGGHIICNLKNDRTFLQGNAVTYSIGVIYLKPIS